MQNNFALRILTLAEISCCIADINEANMAINDFPEDPIAYALAKASKEEAEQFLYRDLFLLPNVAIA